MWTLNSEFIFKNQAWVVLKFMLLEYDFKKDNEVIEKHNW